MARKDLISFDEYGAFELQDSAFLEIVKGQGALVMTDSNSACFNDFCLNDICLRYGSADVVCGDNVPNRPPSLPSNPLCVVNPLCGRNISCGPLATC